MEPSHEIENSTKDDRMAGSRKMSILSRDIEQHAVVDQVMLCFFFLRETATATAVSEF